MVYQVGGQNRLKGFLANNWLDLDNTSFTTLVVVYMSVDQGLL